MQSNFACSFLEDATAGLLLIGPSIQKDRLVVHTSLEDFEAMLGAAQVRSHLGVLLHAIEL